MGFLRQQLAILQDRLAGLTASQKMLAAALAVIVVMTLLYSGRFAGSAERVALLNAPTSADELATLTSTLKAKGIDVTIDAGRVMVAADQQIDAMGAVSFGGLAAEGTTNALDAMLEKITPWQSSGQFDARMNSAKQQYLGAILKKWDGVRSADVVITESLKASIARRDPKLAVYIQTKPNAAVDRRRMANTARQFMAQCVTGLTRENTIVSIDGVQSSAGNDADSASLSSDLLVLKRENENELLAKLNRIWGPIPGVLVSVTVDVDATSGTIDTHDIGKGKYEGPITTDAENQTPGGPPAPGAEPGVVSNVGMDASVASVPAAPSGPVIERLKTTNAVDHATTDSKMNKPGGVATVAGASISVPRSYFVALWRQQQGDAAAGKSPKEAEIRPIIDEVVGKLKASTVAITAIKDASRISVIDLWDLEPVVGGPLLAAATPPGAGGELATFATSHAKEVVLGVLACASLFMVGRMVKKAEPIAATMNGLALAGGPGGMMLAGGDVDGEAPAKAKRKPGSFGGEDVAGEVGGDAVMMGQELDPDVLETSQIIEQVSNYVKQNPDNAAQMIGRWMSRD